MADIIRVYKMSFMVMWSVTSAVDEIINANKYKAKFIFLLKSVMDSTVGLKVRSK